MGQQGIKGAVNGVAVRLFEGGLPEGEPRPEERRRFAVGSGILLDSNHVVTCAHVVAKALGIPETQPDRPGDWVALDAPLGEGSREIHFAEVILWRPVGMKDQQEDIALLRLHKPLENPNGEPLWCNHREQDDYLGHRFLAVGFGKPEGDSAKGECLAGSGGWIKLRPEGEEIGEGYSGGPVVEDRDSRRLLGMVVAYYPHERITYMIPAHHLRNAVAPYLEPPDGMATLLSRTFDRHPQIEALRKIGLLPGTRVSESACLFFDCTKADQPAFLAHHLLLRAHLHGGLRPALSHRGLTPPRVQPATPGVTAFGQALDQAVGDASRWLGKGEATRIVYLELPLDRHVGRYLAGIGEYLARKENEDSNCRLVVLVACLEDRVVAPLRSLYRLLRSWRLRKVAAHPLPPLARLSQDDLAGWDLPAAYADRFHGPRLRSALAGLIPAGERRHYRDLTDDLVQALAHPDYRRSSEHPA